MARKAGFVGLTVGFCKAFRGFSEFHGFGELCWTENEVYRCHVSCVAHGFDRIQGSLDLGFRVEGFRVEGLGVQGFRV